MSVPTKITLSVPDNLMNGDERFGHIIRAALAARAMIQIEPASASVLVVHSDRQAAAIQELVATAASYCQGEPGPRNLLRRALDEYAQAFGVQLPKTDEEPF